MLTKSCCATRHTSSQQRCLWSPGSQAIQDVFTDLNSDVAAGTPSSVTCPVANCATYLPEIYASAFAQASFSGVSTASTGTSPYLSTYPHDYYPCVPLLSV